MRVLGMKVRGVGISVCNIRIAGLKFRAYMYVLCMFGGEGMGGLFDWTLMYNPLCLCA